MTTTEKAKLTREVMAARAASEFQDGWIVNLGVGMPTACSNYIPAGRRVIFHSENGVVGYGRQLPDEEADPYVVNAGGQRVELLPFGAIVHHADSFAIIRAGLIDVTVLGAYQVATNGDFANWKLPGAIGGGIGGAMDLAACSKQVFLIMEHSTREEGPRLLKQCTLPLTAPGVVTLVVTDLGVFQPLGEAFRLVEIAPGYTLEEVQAVTGAPLVVDGPLKAVSV